jgi:hypothetical protein
MIEDKVMDAMVTRIQARTYIVNNSIPVRRYDDRATKDTDIVAIVQAEPADRIAPNAQFFTTMLSLIAQNNSEADVEGDNDAALYADLLDELQNDMTAASLTASIADASVVVDGVVPDNGEYNGGEIYKQRIPMAKLFITYTP